MKKYKISSHTENDFFLIKIRKMKNFSLVNDLDLFNSLGLLNLCFDLEFFDLVGNKFIYYSNGLDIICKNKEEFEKILKNLQDYYFVWFFKKLKKEYLEINILFFLDNARKIFILKRLNLFF